MLWILENLGKICFPSLYLTTSRYKIVRAVGEIGVILTLPWSLFVVILVGIVVFYFLITEEVSEWWQKV